MNFHTFAMFGLISGYKCGCLINLNEAGERTPIFTPGFSFSVN